MRILFSALLAALFLLPTTLQAQDTPRDLRDLVDARARSGESEMESRGYVHIQTQKSDDRSYSYWWNSSRNECVSIATMDGRYHSITESPSSDCNQNHRHHDDGGEAVGAAVAIGAVALLAGLAASSHKSHHHKNGRHHEDNDYEREFERGHNDGLHNHSYDSRNDTAGYIAGYNSGVEQRDHNTSYRHHSGRHDRGYQRSVSSSQLDDLRDARASSADSELSGWGFKSVDRMTSGDTVYLIWYDRSRGQCLQETMADGRVVSIDDIGSHPSCR